MKSKNFIILLTICFVFAIATYIIFNQNTKKNQQAILGQKLFGSLRVNDIAAITINSPEGDVILKKGKSIWTVESRFNYPADFSKITDLAKKLKELKIGRSFNASEDIISRLSLHRPDKKKITPGRKGVRIALADKQNKMLLDLILGKTRESSSRPDGQYVMLSAKSTVYLVDKNFRFLEKEPYLWLNRDLIDIKAKDVEKVLCYASERKKVLYALKRPEKEKTPTFSNAPRGKKAVTSKINQVFEALSSFKIEDVVGPEKNINQAGFKKTPHHEYHLFDGTVYNIYPGRPIKNESEKYYFRIDINYVSPEVKDGDVKFASSPGEENSKDNQAEFTAKVKRLNNKLSPWTYIISKWEHSKFITDPEEFFEKEKVE